MNAFHPRLILRLILAKLTSLVLKKHKPDVIVVTGNGQTSIARECLYTLLYQKFPTRRNLEVTESEFSIPLTIFGEFSYPRPRIMWLLLLCKIVIQLIRIKPYKHLLILEIPSLNREVYNFWVKILRAKFIVEVPETLDLTDKANLPHSISLLINDILKEYKVTSEYLEQELNKLNLPNSRIKLCKGVNGSTIIDARHYFYPPPLASVLEVASSLEGHKVLFSDLREDLEEIKKNSMPLDINPHGYTPKRNDILILRGDKTKFKPLRSYYV